MLNKMVIVSEKIISFAEETSWKNFKEIIIWAKANKYKYIKVGPFLYVFANKEIIKYKEV